MLARIFALKKADKAGLFATGFSLSVKSHAPPYLQTTTFACMRGLATDDVRQRIKNLSDDEFERMASIGIAGAPGTIVSGTAPLKETILSTVDDMEVNDSTEQMLAKVLAGSGDMATPTLMLWTALKLNQNLAASLQSASDQELRALPFFPQLASTAASQYPTKHLPPSSGNLSAEDLVRRFVAEDKLQWEDLLTLSAYEHVVLDACTAKNPIQGLEKALQLMGIDVPAMSAHAHAMAPFHGALASMVSEALENLREVCGFGAKLPVNFTAVALERSGSDDAVHDALMRYAVSVQLSKYVSRMCGVAPNPDLQSVMRLLGHSAGDSAELAKMAGKGNALSQKKLKQAVQQLTMYTQHAHSTHVTVSEMLKMPDSAFEKLVAEASASDTHMRISVAAENATKPSDATKPTESTDHRPTISSPSEVSMPPPQESSSTVSSASSETPTTSSTVGNPMTSSPSEGSMHSLQESSSTVSSASSETPTTSSTVGNSTTSSSEGSIHSLQESSSTVSSASSESPTTSSTVGNPTTASATEAMNGNNTTPDTTQQGTDSLQESSSGSSASSHTPTILHSSSHTTTTTHADSNSSTATPTLNTSPTTSISEPSTSKSSSGQASTANPTTSHLDSHHQPLTPSASSTQSTDSPSAPPPPPPSPISTSAICNLHKAITDYRKQRMLAGDVAVLSSAVRGEVHGLSDEEVRSVKATVMKLDRYGKNLVAAVIQRGASPDVLARKLPMLRNLSSDDKSAFLWRLRAPTAAKEAFDQLLRSLKAYTRAQHSSLQSRQAIVEEVARAFQIESDLQDLDLLHDRTLPDITIPTLESPLPPASELQEAKATMQPSEEKHSYDSFVDDAEINEQEAALFAQLAQDLHVDSQAVELDTLAKPNFSQWWLSTRMAMKSASPVMHSLLARFLVTRQRVWAGQEEVEETQEKVRLLLKLVGQSLLETASNHDPSFIEGIPQDPSGVMDPLGRRCAVDPELVAEVLGEEHARDFKKWLSTYYMNELSRLSEQPYEMLASIQRDMDVEKYLRMEHDINLQMDLENAPATWREPNLQMTEDEWLESMRGMLDDHLQVHDMRGIDDLEWEVYKDCALEEFATYRAEHEAKLRSQGKSCFYNSMADSVYLWTFLEKSIPPESPIYQQAHKYFRVVDENPSWSFAQKRHFISRMTELSDYFTKYPQITERGSPFAPLFSANAPPIAPIVSKSHPDDNLYEAMKLPDGF